MITRKVYSVVIQLLSTAHEMSFRASRLEASGFGYKVQGLRAFLDLLRTLWRNISPQENPKNLKNPHP